MADITKKLQEDVMKVIASGGSMHTVELIAKKLGTLDFICENWSEDYASSTPLTCHVRNICNDKYYDINNKSDKDALKLILKYADINFKDSTGRYPLLYVCKSSFYNKKLFDFFVDNGADIFCSCSEGNGIVEYAKENDYGNYDCKTLYEEFITHVRKRLYEHIHKLKKENDEFKKAVSVINEDGDKSYEDNDLYETTSDDSSNSEKSDEFPYNAIGTIIDLRMKFKREKKQLVNRIKELEEDVYALNFKNKHLESRLYLAYKEFYEKEDLVEDQVEELREIGGCEYINNNNNFEDRVTYIAKSDSTIKDDNNNEIHLGKVTATNNSDDNDNSDDKKEIGKNILDNFDDICKMMKVFKSLKDVLDLENE